MNVNFFLSTTKSGGASALLLPISHRLELGLGNYGTAIDELDVLVVLGAEAGKLVPLREGHHPKLPYRRFLRAKRTMKVGFLSQNHAEDLAPEEYDPAATRAILPEVEAALLGFEASLQPDDDFDFARYAADVRELLGQGFDSVAQLQAEEEKVQALNEARWAAEDAARAAAPAPDPDRKIHTYVIRVPQPVLDSLDGDPVVYQNQFTCIGDWVEVALRNKYLGPGPRLTLELVPPDAPREMLAEWVSSAPFDLEAFDAEQEPTAKKRRIAEMCRDTLVWYVERYGQDPSLVHALFEEMEAAEFRRAGRLKAKITPSRGAYEARFDFVHELDGVQLTALFLRKGKRKIESRVPLGRCPYHPFLLGRLLERSCRFERGELVVEIPVLGWSARAKPARQKS